MRILRIADIPNNRTGGMSRTMYCTGDILNSMGHKIDYLFNEDFSVSNPVFLRRFTVPLQIPGLIRRLAQADKQYDIIEIHEPLAAFYCFIRQIKNNLPPVAIFSYGIEKRAQLAELAYRRQKHLPVSPALRYFRLTVLQSMYGIQHCNHVICSNSEDILYLKKVGIPESRLTQHHSGVDPEFLTAGKAVAEADILRSGVLFVGSWIIRKGILDLVPAVSQVIQRHPLLRFTIAGCSIEADTILSGFASDLHPQIKVIPKLSSNEELIEVYRQHSILVLPSYFEGQPLVMIEAAAMGLAIVTTNICGMADFVENEINGLTVSVGDVEALIQCLDRLVKDEALARRLGEAARQKAQTYTWKSAAEKIAIAYEKTIQDAKK